MLENIHREVIREFPEIQLDNGYRFVPRIKQFSTEDKTYPLWLSLDLYNKSKFKKSILLPLDKIRKFTRALNKIAHQLELEKYEKRCGNCCYYPNSCPNFGKGAPLLKSDRFSDCEFFIPKHLARKVKETPKGLNFDKEHFDKWLRDRKKAGYIELGNGKYMVE